MCRAGGVQTLFKRVAFNRRPRRCNTTSDPGGLFLRVGNRLDKFILRSRGSTHRSPANPLGRRDSNAVRQGTILANRALVLLLILAAKAVWTVLEQPATSCMEYLPLFQQYLRLVPNVRLYMRMGDHGGPTPKPSLLYSRDLKDYPLYFCGTTVFVL